MKKDKSKHTPPPTPRQRLFTDEYNKGDRVYIIRHRHGWEDGRIEGKITELSPMSATVTSDPDDSGYSSKYQIEHPRDISAVSRKLHNWQFGRKSQKSKKNKENNGNV